MTELIPDPDVITAMSIIDRGLTCAIEVHNGDGWEPRVLAFPSATESAVAAAVAGERFRNQAVRAVPFYGPLLREADRPRARMAA